MQRFFCRNLLSSLLAIIALAAAAFLPFGSVANAAPPTSICPGGEGGPFCDLVISAPESVAAGQSFIVKVAITDFEEHVVVPPNDPCAKAVVTLDVYIGEGLFAEYTANASKGVATFTVGGLPAAEGPYTAELHASASGTCNYDAFRFVDVTVVTVPAGQPIAACPNDVVCTQTTSGSGTAATLFTDPTGTGSFSASFVTLGDAGGIGCNDGGPADPNGVLSYTFSGTAASKTIIFGLNPSLVNKGIGLFNVCFSDGSGYHYLPNCSKTAAPPCVVSRTSTQHNGAFITISVPPSDPFVYVE